MTSIWRPARRLALASVAACALLLGAGVAPSSAAAQEKVQVADPYIELHTGPGRGFPVTFVAERDEWIEILLRRTDWFKVRTAGGQEGWVSRAQLATTLTEAGTTKAFRDVLLDDYPKNCVDVVSESRCRPILILRNPSPTAESAARHMGIGVVRSVAGRDPSPER